MDESKPRKETEASWHSTGKTPGANPAENYERFFVSAIGGPLAVDLMEAASLRPGERVLDIACGTGVVARLAAARVGLSGAVAGLDLNPAMLAVARSAAPGASIEWHEASVESIPLSDETFDAALCQLGLQFVADKAAALREMRRVLVPGGRLLVSLPGAMPPLFAAAHQSLDRHLGPEAAGFLRAVFSLHDPDEIRSLLDAADFRDVSLRQDAKVLSLPAPADFLWQYLQSTPLAALVAQASDGVRAALESEVVEKWQDFSSGSGMVYEQDVIIATAWK
jgi:ubiquinone/menaquinone biosynthesis C-methylase UbiE